VNSDQTSQERLTCNFWSVLYRLGSDITSVAPLFVLLAFVLISPFRAIAARKVLVIGNDNYPGNQLKNAVNDATSIAQAFESMGYSTALVTNTSRDAMEVAIERFADGLSNGDTAIFYYAGHGLQVNGENYLVPIDFKVARPSDVKYQGYSLSSLINKLTTHGATTEIVILDACRNNPFLGTRSIQEGWAGVTTSAGTLIAFGTSPGSTASDDPSSSHGLFTQELLKYLTTSPLSAEEMFQRVREDVIRASNGAQVPWTASSLIGSFHFKPGLETASLALPQLPGSAGDGAIGSSGRSVLATQQSTSNHSRSNHFTASDVFAQKRSPLPTATSAEDQQDYYPLIARAAVLAQNGDYDNSVRTLKAVLELDPQCAVALRILGLVFNLMGQHAKSVTALNRAVSIDPEDPRSYYYRCLVLGPSDPSTAVEDCEASLGIDPSDSEVHLGLADALLTLGQLDRARAEAEKAIQLAPGSSLGYSLLGKVTARQGDSTDADQDYKRAIAINDHQ
jgi:uncharacterized caspase-like protein/Tfp pilus assembly protein PilF